MRSRNKSFLVWVLLIEVPVVLLTMWQTVGSAKNACMMDAVRILCDPKLFFRLTVIMIYGMVLMLKEDFNASKVMRYGERYQLWFSQFCFVIQYTVISSAWLTMLSLTAGRIFTDEKLNWMYDNSYYASRTVPAGLTANVQTVTVICWVFICVSFLMLISGMAIVLAAWAFDSFIAGFLIVVGLMAAEAFSPATIFYRRFNIHIEDWSDIIHTVPLKMLYLALIAAVLFLIGLFAGSRKEFYPRERNASGEN